MLNRGAITLLSEVVSCGLNEASVKDLSNESCSSSIHYWKGICEQEIIHKYLVSELLIKVWEHDRHVLHNFVRCALRWPLDSQWREF